MSNSPDRENLLSAVMAVQLGLSSPEDALAALREAGNKDDKPFAQHLQERGDLTSDQQRMLLRILEVHRAAHDENVENCLMSLEVNDSAKSLLGQLTPGGNDLTVEFNRSPSTPMPLSDSLERTTDSGERYRKLLAHAKGGLGEVSIARDYQLKREVALKELQDKHADDPLKKQRFILEGEVTGALEHPGIVPVYSLGFDAQKRPFYAMRFIRGSTLQEAIKEYHESTNPNRLFDRGYLKFRRLAMRLVDVCYAIEYAHSRGVIHRDIKPSNIMLGKYGETYVVDWGMARVLHAEEQLPESRSEAPLLTAELSGSSDTQMGSIMGTPAYMSPEQAAGELERVGFRADVYCLGSTLYAMLCNRPPFDREDVISILRKVQEGEFASPSLVMPHLPKKLEAICLKAMALSPSDRYASAAAFGQDIENWLGDEAILASPDTFSERAFRFVRRHRTWALAGGTAVVLVAVTASVAALLINRARSQAENLAAENAQLAESESLSRQKAERRFLEARRTVDTWLTGFSEALQNYPGVSGFRRHMLERAVKDYERFAQEIGTDDEVQIERGRTLIRLGDLQRRLSQPAKAAASYQLAIEGLSAFSKQSINPNEQREAMLSIAKSHGRLALAANDRVDSSLAKSSFETALDVLHPLVAESSSEDEMVTTLSAIQINFGQFLLSQKQADEAEKQFLIAIQQLEIAVKKRVDSLQFQGNLAAARIGLGQTELLKGEASKAKRHFAAASAIYRAISDLNPDEPKYLEQRAMTHLFLASAERRLGDLEQEALSYELAIEDYLLLSKALPNAIVYQENLALTFTDLGQLQLELNEPEKAATTLREAKKTFSQLVQSYPAIPRFYEEYALTLDNLAQVLITVGEFQQALGEGVEAVSTFERLVKSYPEIPNYQERLAVAESHLAKIWFHLKEFDTCEQKIAASIERMEGLLAVNSAAVSHRYYVATIQSIQGDVFWKQGKKEAAANAYEQAASHWNQLLANTNDPEYQNAAAWYFSICPQVSARKTAVALEAAQQATQAAPSNLRFRDTKALVYFRQKRFSESLLLLEFEVGQDSPQHGRSLLLAAMSSQRLGREQEAQDLFRAAVQWIDQRQSGDWELAKLMEECRLLIQTAEINEQSQSSDSN